MTTAIYKPTGRAREYSPLALNLYEGCDHGCTYCFARSMAARFGRPWPLIIHPRDGMCGEIPRACNKYAGTTDQVLLSFSGDPYSHVDEITGMTRFALQYLLENKIPVAILSKGGSRCLRDLGLFKQFGRSIKVGASLTFLAQEDSLEWEPRAAVPDDRIDTLRRLHESGITTWASLEPVIEPGQSLALIAITREFIDHYKIGRWNYDPRADGIDWAKFGADAVSLLRSYHKPFYIKNDLRPYLGDLKLRPEEMDPDRDNARPFPK